jgi:hypothetical protein
VPGELAKGLKRRMDRPRTAHADCFGIRADRAGGGGSGAG